MSLQLPERRMLLMEIVELDGGNVEVRATYDDVDAYRIAFILRQSIEGFEVQSMTMRPVQFIRPNRWPFSESRVRSEEG